MKKIEIRFEPRLIGILLLVICVVFSVVLISLKSEISEECPCVGGRCPVERSLSVTYIGFTSILILGGIGLYMLVPKQTKKMEKTKEWKKVLKELKGDERNVYQAIVDSGGAIPQSELVEKTNFSKVKVSRTLDKLEVKKLVGRRRRGMGNVVVLK